eukprot:5863489-Amphidinium_carterae.2
MTDCKRAARCVVFDCVMQMTRLWSEPDNSYMWQQDVVAAQSGHFCKSQQGQPRPRHWGPHP